MGLNFFVRPRNNNYPPPSRYVSPVFFFYYVRVAMIVSHRIASYCVIAHLTRRIIFFILHRRTLRHAPTHVAYFSCTRARRATPCREHDDKRQISAADGNGLCDGVWINWVKRLVPTHLHERFIPFGPRMHARYRIISRVLSYINTHVYGVAFRVGSFVEKPCDFNYISSLHNVLTHFFVLILFPSTVALCSWFLRLIRSEG